MDDQKIKDLLNEIKIPEHDAHAPQEAMKAANNVMDGMKTATSEKNSKKFQGKSKNTGQTRKEPSFIERLFGGRPMSTTRLKAGAALAGVAAIVIGVTMMAKDQSAPYQSAMRPPPPLSSAPGQDVDPAYEEALKEKNKRRAQQAVSSGASAMPSPIGKARVPRPLTDGAAQLPDTHVPQDYVGQEEFEDFADSPVKLVSKEPVSTFSADVDTASYSYVRSSILLGALPPKDSVRVEELINYFKYDYAPADSVEEPFKPTVAVYPSPWNENAKLLHVGIKGFEPDQENRPAANLVFLIDTSGSMNSTNKLPLLQDSFANLVDNLRDDDTVSIVTYAGSSRLVLQPTKGSEKDTIKDAIRGLRSGGGTAGAQGIKTAYDLAQVNFDDEALNRVILATDGDFNIGITNNNELQDFVERKRKDGIFLSVLGFGTGNYKDNRMQTLAQNGNGVAYYIDSKREAKKVFGSDLTGTLYTIAKDVKFQVEFNPERVGQYRLIGYETRQLEREDFNNDKVDAGDIGAGHTVTAIYEYIPAGSKNGWMDENRYDQNAENEKAGETDFSDEIAFLKMRYKLPKEDSSRLITCPITTADVTESIDNISGDLQFAAGVAAFGQKLRGGEYIGEFSWKDVRNLAEKGLEHDPDGLRKEFIEILDNIGDAAKKQKIRDEIQRKQQEIQKLKQELR